MPKFNKGAQSKSSSSKGGFNKMNTSSAEQGSSVSATDPLHLGFIPGTEGSGKIAATEKAGLPESGTTYQLKSQLTNSMTLGQVAVLDWIPTLTALSREKDKSAVSTAMYRYYNKIRSNNASLSAYSPIDVFFGMCGVTGVVTLMSAIRLRLQILCTEQSEVNVAFPQGLMAALHLTQSDRDNLANYIADYNQLIGQSKGLMMPKAFRYFARHARLAGSIFLDDPYVDKAQLIIMNPTRVWKWDVNANSPTVGKLVQELVPQSLSAMISLAFTLINSYTLDADVNNQYAEIRKAFADQDVYTLKEFPVTANEGIALEYEQTLLDEIKNAIYVGDVPNIRAEEVINGNLSYVEYDSGELQADPFLPYNQNDSSPFPDSEDFDGDDTPNIEIVTKSHWFYSHENQPGEQTTADLAAFKVAFICPDDTTLIVDCGTEIIQTCRIFSMSANGSFREHCYRGINHFAPWNSNAAELDNCFNGLISGLRRYFNYSSLPPIGIYTASKDSTARMNSLIEGDVDNRYPASVDSVHELHTRVFGYLVATE